MNIDLTIKVVFLYVFVELFSILNVWTYIVELNHGVAHCLLMGVVVGL